MTFAEFIQNLRTLRLKKKGQRPKMNPNKFYPSQAELQTQEALYEELGNYADKLEQAAQKGGVAGVYAVPGAVPDGFRQVVENLAEQVSEFQMRSFASFAEMTVGERYFPNQEHKDLILSTWTENFVNQCKSTNEEMRKKVAGVVSDGVLEGRNLRDITKEIKQTCTDFTSNKAELIATTEVGKLNSAIARDQAQSAGIEYYEWSAAMDGRTRASHAVMDGKICKWGDDDGYYVWSEPDPKTGKKRLVRKPRPAEAYKGAPGTDFRCRCTALPYVPEFEDDYEAERQKGPVRGVTQGENADPETKKMLEELAQKQVLKRLKKREKKSLDVARKFSEKRKDKDAKFEKLSPFVYSDKRRLENPEKNKLARETEMSKVAVANGYPVVFLAELKHMGLKNPDAVMGGMITEFKKGKPSQMEHRIRDALEQANNVFLMIDGEMPVPEFYKQLKRIVNNIRKENVDNAKNKERARTIKKNLKGATLYFSIGDFFNSVKLDDVK